MSTEIFRIPASTVEATEMIEEVKRELTDVENEMGLAVVEHAVAVQSGDKSGGADAALAVAKANERREPLRRQLQDLNEIKKRVGVAEERLLRDRRQKRYEELHEPAEVLRTRITETSERVIAAVREVVLASKEWNDIKTESLELRSEYTDTAQQLGQPSPSWPPLEFRQIPIADGWSISDALLFVRGKLRKEFRDRPLKPLTQINQLARQVVDATTDKNKKGKRPWQRN